ncbi:MAG: hypothetical protein J0L72_04900 [Armatimonadetes bacterium]|nr:hypothetical protein [Armatimonadota bacterium]
MIRALLLTVVAGLVLAGCSQGEVSASDAAKFDDTSATAGNAGTQQTPAEGGTAGTQPDR